MLAQLEVMSKVWLVTERIAAITTTISIAIDITTMTGTTNNSNSNDRRTYNVTGVGQQSSECEYTRCFQDCAKLISTKRWQARKLACPRARQRFRSPKEDRPLIKRSQVASSQPKQKSCADRLLIKRSQVASSQPQRLPLIKRQQIALLSRGRRSLAPSLKNMCNCR